jgi:hypothetical protein
MLYCSYSLIYGVFQLVSFLHSGLQTEIFYAFWYVSLVCFVSQLYRHGIFCLVVFVSVLSPSMYLSKTGVVTAVSPPQSFGM